MNINEFQNVVSDALATIYHPAFPALPPAARQKVITGVREAFYALDVTTPGSDVDYAAASVWAVQTQFNDVMLSHEKAAQSA